MSEEDRPVDADCSVVNHLPLVATPLPGMIVGFVAFDRALTDEEVKAMYEDAR